MQRRKLFSEGFSPLNYFGHCNLSQAASMGTRDGSEEGGGAVAAAEGGELDFDSDGENDPGSKSVMNRIDRVDLRSLKLEILRVRTCTFLKM